MQAIINILNSLVGFFLAVLLVVAGAVVVAYNAISIQRSTATTFYSIDTNSLKKIDTANKEAIKILQNDN